MANLAILIVNGGKDPQYGRWLDLCLSKVRQFSAGSKQSYRIYVWNNNLNDHSLREELTSAEDVHYVERSVTNPEVHIHAGPLQHLLKIAEERDNPEFIVVLDSDAHPVRPGWLDELTEALKDNTVLAGVWRDELKDAIEPFIHPSCACFRLSWLNQNNLRLDDFGDGHTTEDTISLLTRKAQQNGEEQYRLLRSNKNEFHRLIGGIYGDLIYHHGAGSRGHISFHDEEFSKLTSEKYQALSKNASKLLFHRYQDYMGYLRGLGGVHIGKIESYLERRPDNDPRRTRFYRLTRKVRRKVSKDRRLERNQKVNTFKHIYRRNDFPSIPIGWSKGKPHFVGIGVPKAGTSWWYWCLMNHPDILGHMNLRPKGGTFGKELNYFTHLGYRELTMEHFEDYTSAFATLPGCITGEFSTYYLQHSASLEQLSKVCPQVKILVLLRNPIDRYASHLNHLTINRTKALGVSDDENKMNIVSTYSLESEAILYSMYSDSIVRLLELFTRENILFLQYEQCKTNPEHEYFKTLNFLGLDLRFKMPDAKVKINQHKYCITPFTTKERQSLGVKFKPDVERLKILVPELDYSLWAEFSDSSEHTQY